MRKLLGKRLRSLDAIRDPPLGGFGDGLPCAVNNVDAVGSAHDRGICCKTCEALVVSPRSASAIAVRGWALPQPRGQTSHRLPERENKGVGSLLSSDCDVRVRKDSRPHYCHSPGGLPEAWRT
jgi:hypothetical protein